MYPVSPLLQVSVLLGYRIAQNVTLLFYNYNHWGRKLKVWHHSENISNSLNSPWPFSNSMSLILTQIYALKLWNFYCLKYPIKLFIALKWFCHNESLLFWEKFYLNISLCVFEVWFIMLKCMELECKMHSICKKFIRVAKNTEKNLIGKVFTAEIRISGYYFQKSISLLFIYNTCQHELKITKFLILLFTISFTKPSMQVTIGKYYTYCLLEYNIQ